MYCHYLPLVSMLSSYRYARWLMLPFRGFYEKGALSIVFTSEINVSGHKSKRSWLRCLKPDTESQRRKTLVQNGGVNIVRYAFRLECQIEVSWGKKRGKKYHWYRKQTTKRRSGRLWLESLAYPKNEGRGYSLMYVLTRLREIDPLFICQSIAKGYGIWAVLVWNMRCDDCTLVWKWV